MKSAKAASKKSKKALDSTSSAGVESATSTAASDAATPPAQPVSQEQTHSMSITLTRSDKQRKSTNAVFTADGYQGGLKIAKSFFKDRNVPASITLGAEDGALAEARKPKAKMTAEERKAARAAAPKLTPQQKLDKIEERAAKLRAKIASAAPATPAQ